MTVRGEGEGEEKRTHPTTATILTSASDSLMLAQLSQETRGSFQGGVSLTAKQTPNRVQSCQGGVSLTGDHVKEGFRSRPNRHRIGYTLVGPDTPRCGIAGKPNHDTVMPAHALVYQLVLPCATILVHARCVRHSL